MDKIYKKFVRDGGFLNLLDLFDYKLTAVTRATALMELRRIVFSRFRPPKVWSEPNLDYQKKLLCNIDKPQRQSMFIEFRNYLEFDVKENN